MTTYNKKSYLGYLSKLLNEYSNTYHRSFNKKRVDADYSALIKEIKINPKSPKFKVGDRVSIIKYKKIFSKVSPNIDRKKYL